MFVLYEFKLLYLTISIFSKVLGIHSLEWVTEPSFLSVPVWGPKSFSCVFLFTPKFFFLHPSEALLFHSLLHSHSISSTFNFLSFSYSYVLTVEDLIIWETAPQIQQFGVKSTEIFEESLHVEILFTNMKFPYCKFSKDLLSSHALTQIRIKVVYWFINDKLSGNWWTSHSGLISAVQQTNQTTRHLQNAGKHLQLPQNLSIASPKVPVPYVPIHTWASLFCRKGVTTLQGFVPPSLGFLSFSRLPPSISCSLRLQCLLILYLLLLAAFTGNCSPT